MLLVEIRMWQWRGRNRGFLKMAVSIPASLFSTLHTFYHMLDDLFYDQLLQAGYSTSVRTTRFPTIFSCSESSCVVSKKAIHRPARSLPLMGHIVSFWHGAGTESCFQPEYSVSDPFITLFDELFTGIQPLLLFFSKSP